MEPIYLRTSERVSYTRCRQQWWWSYIDCLEAIRTKPALRFGDLVHRALAEWYIPGTKRGTHPAITFEKLYVEQLEEGYDKFSIRMDDDDEWTSALDLGVAMLEGYIERWGLDDFIRVISPEMSGQVPLTAKKGGPLMAYGTDRKKHPVIYALTFDVVFEDLSQGQIGLMETKTAASIRTGHLPLDDQAGSYWLMAPEVLQEKKLLKPNQDIDFIMYNFLRKAMPDTRPKNEAGQYLNKPSKAALIAMCARLGVAVARNWTVDQIGRELESRGIDTTQCGEVSKVQPPALFERARIYRDTEDRKNLMQRIRMQAWEMGLVKAGKLPVYKTPAGSWPDEHCNACEFRDMCMLHETGAEWEELQELTMTTWDPYEEHNGTKI